MHELNRSQGNIGYADRYTGAYMGVGQVFLFKNRFVGNFGYRKDRLKNWVGVARLERALASWHGQYNPAEQMARRPFSSPGYHTKLTGGFVHPTRDSLNYALGLLDTGKPEHLERATAIVRRVVSLQDNDPARRTYGIWSWFMEEPLDKMRQPDLHGGRAARTVAAIVAFTLAVDSAPPSDAQALVLGAQLSFSAGGLTVSAPLRPVPRP